MAILRLDPKLLGKLAEKTGKSQKYLREQISRRANKLGVSSEAAQILWAKEKGLGTGAYQRKLSVGIQEEVRNSLPVVFAQPKPSSVRSPTKTGRVNRNSQIGAAIEYLLQDEELRGRCKDLLKASKHYDRAIREATTVLDDRLKKLTGIKGMLPQDLIGKVLNPDPQKAIIVVSSDRPEQEGFFSICKGLGLSFRNPTHHNLSNKFTQQDAMKFCGFVDAILALLSQATVRNSETSAKD
jgi:uncharacterized protein (TIGR02391 family)